MMDRGPIDDCHPAMLFFRKGDDTVDQQFIRLPFGVQVVRVKGQGHSVSQRDALATSSLGGRDAVQAQTAVGVRVVKVGIILWLFHVARPSTKASSGILSANAAPPYNFWYVLPQRRSCCFLLYPIGKQRV